MPNELSLSPQRASALRQCRKCGVSKPVEMFYRDKRYPDGDIHCAECRKAKVKEWRDANLEQARLISKRSHAKNPERARVAARNWYLNNRSYAMGQCARRRREKPRQIWEEKLRAAFGISAHEYEIMLLLQDGVCAICKKTPEQNGKRLAVDHDHDTGRNRGLLCSQCNKGIGNLQDSPNILRSALSYLVLRKF